MIHQEALNEKGKEIWPKLKNFTDFYLAGGTALALQLGHRISVDFDFFSSEPIEKNLLLKIKKLFPDKTIFPSVNNPQELTIFIDEVKITFLQYPFPLMIELVNYEGVKILDIKEIAATKAYTVGRRGSLKDYVDLYFIVFDNYAILAEIIEIAEKKYGGEFNSRLFLEQLIYLDDVEEAEILFLKDKISKNIVADFFAGEIKKIRL